MGRKPDPARIVDEWRVYSYWATEYEEEHGATLRDARIEALCWFFARCAAQARRRPGDAWWARHALWALQRLDQLGYAFPEVDGWDAGRMVA